jgi:hypothetical protein
MGVGRLVSPILYPPFSPDSTLLYGSKHQIITCSGGRNTGSLNVVRNGADFQALAVAEGLRGIVSVWPIRALFEDT